MLFCFMDLEKKEVTSISVQVFNRKIGRGSKTFVVYDSTIEEVSNFLKSCVKNKSLIDKILLEG